MSIHHTERARAMSIPLHPQCPVCGLLGFGDPCDCLNLSCPAQTRLARWGQAALCYLAGLAMGLAAWWYWMGR